MEAQEIILSLGATPATFAIINGRVHAGLSDCEIKNLASMGNDAIKLSNYDIPAALALEKTGSTTVSGTISCASKLGITTMATGGIGGVHRGFPKYWDVSHDLQTLAKTKMIVVCAGAKVILDLPATLEYLETLGVLVAGWKTNILPAFYHDDSGLKLNYQINEFSKIKKIFNHLQNSSLLITNPPPREHQINKKALNNMLEDALVQAKENRISGKQLTPFLLAKLNKLSDGKTLVANRELIKNNAILAAMIAKEISL